MPIGVSLPKAKDIAHTARRTARAAEFEPYDAIIMKQIPGADAVKAEAERQKIREKYTVLQGKMDAATSVDELKSLMP